MGRIGRSLCWLAFQRDETLRGGQRCVVYRTNIDCHRRDHWQRFGNIGIDRTLLNRDVISERIDPGEVGQWFVDEVTCSRIERETRGVLRQVDHSHKEWREQVGREIIVCDDGGFGCGVGVESVIFENGVLIIDGDRQIDVDDFNHEVLNFTADGQAGWL